MGTTTKALKLLDQLTATRPELGLSAIARSANIEKATAYRLLNELCAAGLMEQNPHSKLYRLGPALIRYANLREQTFPAKHAAAQHLEQLVSDVRETVHVTELQGTRLSPVHSHESIHHSTRVRIDPAEMLPLHATSSGKVVLAFSDDSLLEQVLAAPMPNPTGKAPADADALMQQVMNARATGFGQSDGEFELDVSSIAAPLFGSHGRCVGAVAVVCPSARMTPDLRSRARQALKSAARAITLIWGGNLPRNLQEIWEVNGHD